MLHFIDRMMLFWHSADALAAAMPAGLINLAVICFFLGVAAYTNTFVAQYYGAGRHERIGLAVWQGAGFGMLVAPFVIATIPFAPRMFAVWGHAPEVQVLEVTYYQILCFGAPAMVIAQAFGTFFTGRGDVRTLMYVDIASAVMNIVLDYAWIFGYWGFPAWGIAGAAWATVISQWAKAAVLLYLLWRPRHRAEFRTWADCRPDWALAKRLLWFGSPSGLQILAELAAFSVFLMLVGRLGKLELTATNLAFSVNSLAFVPLYGFGIAAMTMVGQRLGENRPDLADRSTWSVFVLAMTYLTIISFAYLVFPDFFLMGHRAQVPGAEFMEVRNLTVVLLRFVALYCLFDGLKVVFAHSIEGAGDTRFVLYVVSTTSILMVAATWWIIEVAQAGLWWSWWVVVAYLLVQGIIFLVRFRQGKWRQMRVIEHATGAEPEIPLSADSGAVVEVVVAPAVSPTAE